MTTTNIDKIDRQSPVPLYFQLAGLLTEDITRGRWSPVDRLVSEAEMCDSYGVSRATVRQALQRLENEGLIERVKGRVPTLVGVSSLTTERTVHHARHAEKLGASAVMILPMSYWKLTDKEILEAFKWAATGDGQTYADKAREHVHDLELNI